MDYSNRVNSKKGSGGVAGTAETNVQTKQRLKELLTTQLLDIDNDPYVFRNHLGLLECRLCLTTHVSESSYISHLGGRKHQVNLERRKVLDEKYGRRHIDESGKRKVISISNVPKISWTKIGRPAFRAIKIRHPETFQIGLLFTLQYPRTTVEEPYFRLMSYYELNTKNQNALVSFMDQNEGVGDDFDPNQWQYVVFSAEPYENVCFAIPNSKEIDRPSEMDQMSDSFWWYWDKDTNEYFLQFMYK